MNCGVKEIAAWLLAHDDIAVVTHYRPDGDALGSSFALVAALKAMGKRAFAACSDPVPVLYSFLDGAKDCAVGGEMPFKPACFVSVDVAGTERMGVYAEAYNTAAEKIAVDHHGTNPGFGDLSCVEPNAAAAGEIVLEIIKAMGVSISPDIAEALYTAISTDCGNFSFSCTTKKTMAAAGECIELGADPEKLSRILFRLRSEGTTRLLGEALSRIEMSPGKKVALIALPKSEYERFGCAMSDSHAFVNYLNEIKGVKIGIMVDETDTGSKVSFRGADGTDVSVLAQKFGGGGHSAAAGANFPGKTLEETRREVMAAAIEYVEK